MLCALMYRQNSDLANLLKSARKKTRLSVCVGGCNCYSGNAQIEPAYFFTGASFRLALEGMSVLYFCKT